MPADKTFFLFGPRGAGKSTLLRQVFPGAARFDLLDLGMYAELLAHTDRLEALAQPRMSAAVVIDEIQRVPALLDEVHRQRRPDGSAMASGRFRPSVNRS